MSKLESKIGQIRNFPSGRAVMAAALVAAMASGLAACSATPDAVKPEAIYGPGDAAPTPEGTKGFPELANTPDERPKATSAADQKAIQDELKKDRETAEGKDSALRAGQAGSVAAKPTPQRQAEIDKAAANAETASIASPVEAEKPKAAAVAAPAVVAAAAPKPAPEAPAPVAAAEPAPEPAPEPQKVAAAEPAPAPAPKQELATPYVAPNLPPEPAKEAKPVAAAGATAGTAALLEKVNDPAPAAEMQMASAETNVEPAASPAVAAAPAIVNGIIPMPARGGHKSLAAIMPKQEEFEDEGTEKAEQEEPEAKAAEVVDPNAEAPVTAAPTTKVDVKPASAPTAP